MPIGLIESNPLIFDKLQKSEQPDSNLSLTKNVKICVKKWNNESHHP